VASARTQLKFEVVDLFKNKTPAADVTKNDRRTVYFAEQGVGFQPDAFGSFLKSVVVM
jgi:hypothetical protein